MRVIGTGDWSERTSGLTKPKYEQISKAGRTRKGRGNINIYICNLEEAEVDIQRL